MQIWKWNINGVSSSFAVFISQVEMWKYVGQGRIENYSEMSQSISYKTFHKFPPEISFPS